MIVPEVRPADEARGAMPLEEYGLPLAWGRTELTQIIGFPARVTANALELHGFADCSAAA